VTDTNEASPKKKIKWYAQNVYGGVLKDPDLKG